MHTQIHPMTPGDLTRVLEIEEQSFHRPWSRGLFQEELDHKDSYNLIATTIPEDCGNIPPRVVAFISFRITFQEMQLFKIAVDPNFRGGGTGMKILDQGLEKARGMDAESCYLEVRKSNVQAIRLYEKSGFTIIGTRPNYYTHVREDALIMTKQLR